MIGRFYPHPPDFTISGYGYIRDHPAWRTKRPGGPVSFDLWNCHTGKIVKDVLPTDLEKAHRSILHSFTQ